MADLASKLLKLTEDKVTTTTPSLLDTIASIFSMLYFSGAMDKTGKKKATEEKLPGQSASSKAFSQNAVANAPGNVLQEGYTDFSPFDLSKVSAPGMMMSPGYTDFSAGTLTPEMLIKILIGLGGR